MSENSVSSSFDSMLKSGVAVVNFGMERFSSDLKEQGVSVVHVDWRPPAAKSSLLSKLGKLKQNS